MNHKQIKDNYGSAEIWKVSLMGFILLEMRSKYPKLQYNHLFVLLFLSHFRYADLEFIHKNSFEYLKERYVFTLLKQLAKFNLVEQINMNMNDLNSNEFIPEIVYKLSPIGKRVVSKIFNHLNGTLEFFDFNL